MYKPGESGNPSGRKPGSGKVDAARRMLYAQSKAIIQTVIDRALEGDPVALRLATERLVPTLRSVDAPITIALPGDVVAQSAGVIGAMASGKVTPDTAMSILSALRVHAELNLLRDLERRLTALEGEHEPPRA